MTRAGTPVGIAASGGATTAFTINSPGLGSLVGVRVDIHGEDLGTIAEMMDVTDGPVVVKVGGVRVATCGIGELFPIEAPVEGEGVVTVEVVHANHSGAVDSVIVPTCVFVVE